MTDGADLQLVCGIIPRLCVAVYTSALLCSVVSSAASMRGLVWYNTVMLVYFGVIATLNSARVCWPNARVIFTLISHHIVCVLLAGFALDPVIALLYHGPFQLLVVDVPIVLDLLKSEWVN